MAPFRCFQYLVLPCLWKGHSTSIVSERCFGEEQDDEALRRSASYTVLVDIRLGVALGRGVRDLEAKQSTVK